MLWFEGLRSSQWFRDCRQTSHELRIMRLQLHEPIAFRHPSEFSGAFVIMDRTKKDSFLLVTVRYECTHWCAAIGSHLDTTAVCQRSLNWIFLDTCVGDVDPISNGNAPQLTYDSLWSIATYTMYDYYYHASVGLWCCQKSDNRTSSSNTCGAIAGRLKRVVSRE